MEYQVTATRLRPQKFEDLLGQEFVAATLQKSIEAGKIAHAYLFSGPRGCGKTSSARILAKVINCIEGLNPSPCGKCTACQEITAGSCLDVIEIDGASNTSVNDVRQIKDEILFPPNSNRYKVYIIDEVHMLSTSAFNALLKTIEEPPPYVVFIFATTEIHKVPATIKSRCQQFNFKLVPVETLKDALSKACEFLNIEAEDEALYWIAREATGSVRDAYTLFDQVAAFSDGHITFEKIHQKLGLTGIDSINKLAIECVHKNPTGALQVIDEILQSGISVEQVVLDCADYFRSLLLIKHNIKKEAVIGQRADRFPEEVLQLWSSIQIEQALSIMLQLFKDIRFSIDPRYELELAVSRLVWLVDFVSPIDLKKAFDAARNLLSGQAHFAQSAIQGANSNSYNQTGNVNSYNQMGTENSFSQAGGLTEQFKAVLQRKAKLSQTEIEPKVEPLIKATTETNSVQNYDSDVVNSAQITRNQNEKKDIVKNENSELKNNPKAITENNVIDTENNIIDVEDIDSFRDSIIDAIAKKNVLVSSALAQSKDWEIKNEKLFIFVKSSFDMSLLQKQISVVQNTIKQISGNHFNIILKEALSKGVGPTVVENKNPILINWILDLFMGEVIEKSLIEDKITRDFNDSNSQDIA